MDRAIQRVGFNIPSQPKAKRVVAYARVSSGKDAMLHSLSAQVSYYSNFIQNHPGWLYCGVYADEALTGTKESREQFQRLLAECRAGNIEILLPIWIQSHDSLENEPPLEYPLNPLFSNRYKYRKRSEPLPFISMPGAFSVLNNSFPLLSFGSGSASCSSSIGLLINMEFS